MLPLFGSMLFCNCCFWCIRRGPCLTLFFSFLFCQRCCFCCCFLLLHEVKRAAALPCHVLLSKVVQGVYLQGVCSSGVSRKQSQHRWCSMPYTWQVHSRGSWPSSSAPPLSLFPSLSLSVWCVCRCLSLYVSFLSSAPAAFLYWSAWCFSLVMFIKGHNSLRKYSSLLQLLCYFYSFSHHLYQSSLRFYSWLHNL